MRSRTAVVATVLLGAVACARPATDASPATTPPATTPPASSPPVNAGGTPLPLGKSDVALVAGRWRSPETFAPPVSVAVTGTGWQSAHRYADFFDVGRPEPGRDLPRLAVAFSVAGVPRAADVVRDVRARMAAAATAPVADRIGSLAATRFDVVGGSGEAYRSATGGFGLYGERGQRLRFWVADAPGGAVLVVTAIVPDARRNWAAELPRAAAVVASARVG